MNQVHNTRRYAAAAFASAMVGCLPFQQPAHAAGLLIADGGNGGVLEIREQSVDVLVNNGIAVTTVEQVFHNTENRQVEALYTFPVPGEASVSDFTMWIGGKEMVGEVLRKEKAREIYNSYKQVRKDPGLLEQVDYRTFEMRIFPIAPNADQRIRLTYYQPVNMDNDQGTYVYPLAQSTRPEAATQVKGKVGMRFRVKSEIPIEKLECPSHPGTMAVAHHGERLAEASMESAGGDLARDIVLTYKASRPMTGLDLITSRKEGENGFFSLSLTAGKELEDAVDPGMDFVFLLDMSGSMDADQKFGISRQSIKSFLNTMGPRDRFNVVAFNIAPDYAFPKLTDATTASLEQGIKYLDNLSPKGGTDLNSAMNTAYLFAAQGRSLNIILLSDGLTDPGARESLVHKIAQRPTSSTVFCVGVGNDVNRQLLDQLARDSGGIAQFISRQDDFTRQAAAFRRKLKHPSLQNLKLDFDGVQVSEVVPAMPSNLYHGTPIRLYGRYSSAGTGKVHVSGTISGRPFSETMQMEFPSVNGDNPELARMWALKQVDQLMEQRDKQSGQSSQVIDRIVSLGEEYSILTEYTSFLVLENEQEYQRWKIERRNAARFGADKAKQDQLRAELDRLRSNSLARIRPVDSSSELAEATPAPPRQMAQASTPPPQMPASPPVQKYSPPERYRNSFTLFPAVSSGSSGRSGGAIDPVTALLMLGAGGVGVSRARRQRKHRKPR